MNILLLLIYTYRNGTDEAPLHLKWCVYSCSEMGNWLAVNTNLVDWTSLALDQRDLRHRSSLAEGKALKRPHYKSSLRGNDSVKNKWKV